MRGSYESGIELVFYYYPDGDLGMLLFNPDWKIEPKQSYPVKVTIDKGFAFSAAATSSVEGGQDVAIDIPDTEKAFAALRHGHVMTVDAQGGRFEFLLTGTSAALSRLVDCTMAHVRSTSPNPFAGNNDSPFDGGDAGTAAGKGSEGQGTNPFGGSTPEARTASPSAPSTGGGASPDRVNIPDLVETLFDQRELAGFYTVPSENDSQYQVSWEGPEDTSGVILALTGDLTPEGFLRDAVSYATSSCEGDAASSRSKSPLPNGTSVTTLTTVCRDSDGNVATISSIYPQPWGHLVTVTIGADSAAARQVNQRLFDTITEGPGRSS